MIEEILITNTEMITPDLIIEFMNLIMYLTGFISGVIVSQGVVSRWADGYK